MTSAIPTHQAQMPETTCSSCVAGGEAVPTQNRCPEARDLDDDDDDEPQRPAGRLPMRSMLLRRGGERF